LCSIPSLDALAIAFDIFISQFMEVAYGYEQGTEREKGATDCCAVLDSLTRPDSGMLSTVSSQAAILLRARRSQLFQVLLPAGGTSGAGGGSSTVSAAALKAACTLAAEVVALATLALLAQAMGAVGLTKMSLLRQDAVSSAVHTLMPTTPGRGELGGGSEAAAAGVVLPLGMVGPQRSAHTQPRMQQQGLGLAQGHALAGSSPAGVSGTGAGAAVGGMPPGVAPADSASSTLEPASTCAYGTWLASVQALSSHVRQWSAAAALWQGLGPSVQRVYAQVGMLALACAGAFAANEEQCAHGSSMAAVLWQEALSTLARDEMPSCALHRQPTRTHEAAAAAAPSMASLKWMRHAQEIVSRLAVLQHDWGCWDMLGSIAVARAAMDGTSQLLAAVVPEGTLAL
jgi:hypothetical protein